MNKEENNQEQNNFAIEVINLTHCYNTYPAVDKVSFHVKTGTVFGLLGPNGAGKSTTIKMLTTLLPITSGIAHIKGYDVDKEPRHIRENIGYVPQLISADGELTGYENLQLSAKLYGLNREVRKQRIDDILNFMHLKDFADQQVKQYSGGMIRRLEIGQALIHQPSVLFLDEPAVGLDPIARKNLWELIERWRKSYNTTILLTTHDMDEADKLCDTVAFMHLGHIVAMDSPENLKAELGPGSNLDDVFVHHTGTLIKEGGDFDQVKQVRRTISHLE